MGRASSDDSSHDPTKTSDVPERAPGSLAQQPLGDGRFPAGMVLAGRYRVVAMLGRGGMGEVYRADDLKLQQPVALKLLPPGLASDPGRLARFHNEVRLARQVSHPNVCRVHDIGEADGLTFLTMEHVDGEDLASLLRRVGRLPSERAVVVARQICAGLGAAHERGVLHRDLKPANVMIDGRGSARITDFGLAVVAGDAGANRESAGTPAYMAPEQIEGRELSERTDVYALGLVLYELFTGRRVFEADTLKHLLEMQRSSPPPAPTTHVPDLDPKVERAILQCLEKQPSRRPNSAMAVAAALAGPDALAAAIAAGETPSPEMVAAAGGETGLRPAVAVALAALAVAVQLLGATLNDRAVLLNRIPLDKPPEALAARAREILSRLGRSERPADQAYGFAYDRQYLRWIEDNDRSLERWERLSKGQPAALHFWYRESARPMAPYNQYLIVTPRDPPLEPGMALVRLDTEGRLVELMVPAEGAASTGSDAAAPFDALMAEAGLDPATFRVSSRTWLPPVFADNVAAFEGAFPQEPTIPLRVEAAARAAEPVAFRVRGPWDDRPDPPAIRRLGAAAAAVLPAVLVPVLLIGLLLARRNDRLGRSDRRGAVRIAVFIFCCDLVSSLLSVGHSRSPFREWSLFADAAGGALFLAAAAWVLYVALEPYIRRRWPEALVSWSRLMAGRFKDPLIGRDVLVAALAAAICANLLPLFFEVPRWRGRPTPPFILDAYLSFLLGPRRLLAWLIDFAGRGVLVALMLLLLFVLFQALLRRQLAAVGALWVVWTAMIAFAFRPSPEQLLVLGASSAVVILVVVRYGLLAMAVSNLMAVSLVESLATTRFGAWYAQPALLLYLLAASLLGWGLYASLSTRPFRWEEMLER